MLTPLALLLVTAATLTTQLVRFGEGKRNAGNLECIFGTVRKVTKVRDIDCREKGDFEAT